MFVGFENTDEENFEIFYLKTKIEPIVNKVMPILLSSKSETPEVILYKEIKKLKKKKKRNNEKLFVNK